MKLFVSWSGAHSHAIALALRSWLPYIFTDLQIFVSTEDVRKGKRWLPEISKELGTTNLRNADIEGPLSNFQSTVFNKSEFLKLIQSINTKLGKARLDEQRLKTMFEKWWSDLEKAIGDSCKESETSTKPKRRQEEVLSEVLEITREIARNMKGSSEAEEYRKMQKLLSMSVKELELSDAAAAVLHNASILTIGSLAQKTEAEMKKYRGLSTASLNELKAKLAALGLTFGTWFEEGLLTA
jgi:hypothetical protein